MKLSAHVKGMRLLAAITVAIALMCAALVLAYGATAEAAHAVVRWTARTSLVMFALAYVSRPLVQLKPTRTARDILAYRKWLGLAFAASHGFHLAGIVAIAWPDPAAFIRAQDPTIVIAAVTFVLLGAMAVTSHERIKKKLKPATWKRLHRTGMHFAWVSFFGTYATAIGASLAYLAPTVLLAAIASIRVAAHLRGKRHQRAASQAA